MNIFCIYFMHNGYFKFSLIYFKKFIKFNFWIFLLTFFYFLTPLTTAAQPRLKSENSTSDHGEAARTTLKRRERSFKKKYFVELSCEHSIEHMFLDHAHSHLFHPSSFVWVSIENYAKVFFFLIFSLIACVMSFIAFMLHF